MIETVITAIKDALPANLAERRFFTSSSALTAHAAPGSRIIVFPTTEVFQPGRTIRTPDGTARQTLFIREVEVEHWLWEKDRTSCEALLHEYLTILHRLTAAPFTIRQGEWLNADNTSPQQHGEAFILRTTVQVPVAPVESFVLLEGIDLECGCDPIPDLEPDLDPELEP